MRIFFGFLIFFIAVAPVFGQPHARNASRTSGDEQELLRLQRLVSEASQRADADALRRLIADDFLLTYSRGKPDSYGKFFTKEQVVARWGTPNPDIESSFTISDRRALVAGNTAVVFARITDKWRDKSGAERMTDSWV